VGNDKSMTASGFRCDGCGRLFPPGKTTPECCERAAVFLPDVYSVLNCQSNYSRADIDRQFRTLAMRWHPDRSALPGARETFIIIANAYQLLRDPEKRKEYDSCLSGSLFTDQEYSFASRFHEREVHETSRSWSEESFSSFYEKISAVSGIFWKISDWGRDFLSLPEWPDRATSHRGRLAVAAYALTGFWFAILGGLLFPMFIYRSFRRKPQREEAFLYTLGILQLLQVLGYLIVLERVPLLFHPVFWAMQGISLSVLLVWKRLFRSE